MIIESAFFKLPELLLGHMFPAEQYESTLNNYLAMGVLLELNARNVPLPMTRVHIEKPYPSIGQSRSPGLADLYADLQGLFPESARDLYGMKPNNWIETKFFSGIDRRAGTEPRTTNAAELALDLLRLCLYVQDRSRTGDNTRYLVVVLDREPSEYLAFRRRDGGSERSWMRDLLRPGENQLHIDLTGEPDSFRKIFGPSFFAWELKVVVQSFSPVERSADRLYWGYLVRLTDFVVRTEAGELVCRDIGQGTWRRRDHDLQLKMASTFLQGTRLGRRQTRSRLRTS